MQVFPHLYGDNRPRLFTYWTVCKLIEVKDQVEKYNFFLRWKSIIFFKGGKVY